MAMSQLEAEQAAARLEELRGIRMALERLATVVEAFHGVYFGGADAIAAAEPTGCQHPTDQRIDFGLTNSLPDWQCGVCGFRSVDATGAAA